MVKSNKENVFCRLITDDIIDQVVECLKRGFPRRPRSYWVNGLERMAKLAAIDDYPQYGYALEAKGQIVGALLLIYSRCCGTGGSGIRCNISSWCVDAEYRGYAFLLHVVAVKRAEVTYLNISPAEHTRPAVEAWGFGRYTNGEIFSLPMLSAPRSDVSVHAFTVDAPGSTLLSKTDRKILADHSAFGCLSLLCVKGGVPHPFVFQRRTVARVIPCAQLIYCRSLDEFADFASPIGRYLLFRSGPFCIVDTFGSVAGLVGRYFPERNLKYFKGPDRVRVGDLSYTELVVFGP
jgi:hypothetical protein